MSWHQPVGVTLACLSGFFIGSSLVVQKRALMLTEQQRQQSEHSYLKSPLWWIGMVSLALGEIFNFVAYAFAPTVLVTPLAAISVIVAALFSVFLLKEVLTFSCGCGIVLTIIGSTVIVLHAPETLPPTEIIPEFFKLVFAPGFISYSLILLLLFLFLVFKAGPVYGSTQPAVYLTITAIAGAYLTNAAQGFGAALLHTIARPEDSQFVYWGVYPLMAFLVLTIVFQINYLNKALSHFSASIVTPLNYVFFSTATLITSSVLNQGFSVSSVVDGITILLGFLVNLVGVLLIIHYNVQKERNLQKQDPVIAIVPFTSQETEIQL